MTPALTPALGEAVARLAEALSTPASSDLLRAGCIQYFEFCFELAWKAIKSEAADQGVECNSPKACLRQAYTLGWIDEEEVWLAMLAARNQMSHTYSSKDALAVYDQLAAFLTALAALHETLRSLD